MRTRQRKHKRETENIIGKLATAGKELRKKRENIFPMRGTTRISLPPVINRSAHLSVIELEGVPAGKLTRLEAELV